MGSREHNVPVKQTVAQPAPVPTVVPVMTSPEPDLEPEPEPEPEPYIPTVMPTPRQPFINERPQVRPEPETVPIQVPRHDPAPPRRFAPLASIEPEDNSDESLVSEVEPTYEDVEPKAPAPRTSALTDPDLGLPLEDDDLDVPAFIRRKVD